MLMESAPKSSRRRVPFYVRIIVAMGLGIALGEVLRSLPDAYGGLSESISEPLGELGSVVIGLIKALAGPLLMLAVVDAFLHTLIKLRSGLIMVAITMTNAAIAVVIGLTLSNVLRPGDHMAIPSLPAANGAMTEVEGRKIDFFKEVSGYIPTSVVKPFVDNSVISIIFLAVLAGLALRHVKNEQIARGEGAYRVVDDFVSTSFRTVEIMLGYVIALVPVAVFGVVARTIARDGFAPLLGLGAYVGVAVLGLAIQVLIVYQLWVVLIARMPLRRFWAGAREALIFVVGSSSSLATLPVTLRCLDRMKVSPRSARLAACVGTNLNNDGILLYEAMAVLFVAQVHDIHLSMGQQLVAALSCVMAGIGIAAVPDAGLISLALVLATVGLPLKVLPLLLTVDWLLSRCRAVTNVTSDILVAVLLDRFDNDQEDAVVEPAHEKRHEPTLMP
jgi:Na+/H+-dicarboxylate symporter